MTTSNHHKNKLSFLLLLLAFTPTVICQDEEPALTITPVTAVEVGEPAELNCVGEFGDVNWYQGETAEGKSPYMENENLRIYTNNTVGTLFFVNTTVEDSGTYLCQTPNGNHNATAELHVYAPYDYFKEGMIIFGVNLGLVVIFAACALYTVIQKRQQKKKKERENLKKSNVVRTEI